MAGLNALTQLNGLQVQARHLRECANFDDADDDNDDVPEEVTEGVAGPSKKRKHK